MPNFNLGWIHHEVRKDGSNGPSFSDVSEVPEILEGPKTRGQTCKIESLLLMEEIRRSPVDLEKRPLYSSIFIKKKSYMSGGAGFLPSTVC